MTEKPEKPRRPPLTPEEQALWQQVVQDAAPLKRRRTAGRSPDAPPEPAGRPPETAEPPPAGAPPQPPPSVATAPQPGRRGTIPGLDRRTTERLRQGRLPIDGRLDLHGLTQPAAHAALLRFVEQAIRDGRRCLLVITGKGNRPRDDSGSLIPERAGVLRQSVPRWLAEPALARHVIAIHPAAPQHGGAGALYLLLRRRRDGGPGEV